MAIVKLFADEIRTITRDGVVTGTYSVDGLVVERERARQVLARVMSIDPASLPSGPLKDVLIALRAIILLAVPMEELR